MSNHNVREIRTHRKSKVSWAMAIIPGLVGPKARPKGVVDGQQVNIPALQYYSMEGRILVRIASYWIDVDALRVFHRQIREALTQGVAGTLVKAKGTIRSRVPGKTPTANNNATVLKTDTGGLGE